MTNEKLEADLQRFNQQFRERLTTIFTSKEITIYDSYMAQQQPTSKPDKTAEEQQIFAKLFADREAAWLYERCTLLAYELRYRQQHGLKASGEPADPTATQQ